MEVHCDEGVAIHIGPRAVRRCPRGCRRSVGRGTHRPAIEPRKFGLDLGADAVIKAESNTVGRAIASARTARRGLRHWHVRKFLAREPGDLGSDQPQYGLARIGKARSCSQ